MIARLTSETQVMVSERPITVCDDIGSVSRNRNRNVAMNLPSQASHTARSINEDRRWSERNSVASLPVESSQREHDGKEERVDARREQHPRRRETRARERQRSLRDSRGVRVAVRGAAVAIA